MLTAERHQHILELLQKHHTIKLKQLVQHTQASESTIRRDLDQLEQSGKLHRVHGGASLRHATSVEPTIDEKYTKFHPEKKLIAEAAASLVRDGESIFIDAGTTTYEMISYLSGKDITVVTNGLNQLDALTDYHIKTYVLGGYVKERTRAVVGTSALQNLKQYRFDQCFMGANGISLEDGYTTPDPEEAAIKRTTLALSQNRYILADQSKFNEVTFSQIANIEEANIITDYNGPLLHEFQEKTNIKVVTP
ncbi:DeoR/GlpR family DNA-binding transcription regulator [Halobacillus sp. A1]|uniref:DeoR/GlpR family DNA-binding transcription regulator n=1 Tax=Halobacillus sp. A1 TaxID=2880262 RepID=UPI0020A6BA6D|nr:DeoR/GlpR family DNA-binding transcription regulator [Halobacillus sp. A1]MCP3031350.1 DeoR/GlpR family DNA-binding transcription regulator [Halobacillus sp. A1]